MYSVSQDYLNNIGKNGRVISWYGTITLEDGETVYNFDATNMSADNFSLTMEISSDQIEIGSTGSAELKLGLKLTEVNGQYYLDGKTVDRYALYNSIVRLYFRLYYDDTYEDVPMGIFTVAEPSRSKKTIILDAFDNMVLFNTPIGTLGDGTPYDLINYICLQCGVELGNTEAEIRLLTNGTELLTPGQSVTVSTWRDAIGQIASILCAVAVIGRDGKLYLKQYSTTLTRQIDKTFRYSYEVADYETFYTGIKTYDMAAEEEIGGGSGADGLVYDLGTNGFIQGANISQRMLAVMNKLDDFSYTPFSASTISDPSLECLDVIEFVGDQAVAGKYATITSITYGFGAMEISCTGKNPKVKDAQSRLSSTVGNMSQTKGGVRIISATNTATVAIADGETKSVVNINVNASVQTSIILAADIKYSAVTNETVANGTYTNTDLVITAGIFLNNVEQGYNPVQTEQDGVRTFHISYPMVVPAGSNELVIKLNCDGGDSTVQIGNAQLSVVGAGIDTLRVVSIEVGNMPTKLFQKGTVKYDGLVIDAIYNNGSATNVTENCTITPAEGTAIGEDAEYVSMTADYDRFHIAFDAPVNPMFAFKRQTEGKLNTSETAGYVQKIGNEYFYIQKYEYDIQMVILYANIVLDDDGRPLKPTKTDAWMVNFNKSVKGIETFVVGTKMYAMHTNGGSASVIYWNDLATKTYGTCNVTLHDDPNASGRTVTGITIVRDQYLEYPGIYEIDGYQILAYVNVSTTNGNFSGFAYLDISGTSVDVYAVSWATIGSTIYLYYHSNLSLPYYGDLRTVDGYRFTVKKVSGGIWPGDERYNTYIDAIHFDTTNYLTATPVFDLGIVTAWDSFGYLYKIDGTDALYDFSPSGNPYDFIVNVEDETYESFDTSSLVRFFDGKMRYIASKGAFIHMETDTSGVDSPYLTPMMYYSTDLENWTKAANKLKENTPVEFSRVDAGVSNTDMASNLIETDDGYIIGSVYDHSANQMAYSVHIDADLGE